MEYFYILGVLVNLIIYVVYKVNEGVLTLVDCIFILIIGLASFLIWPSVIFLYLVFSDIGKITLWRKK